MERQLYRVGSGTKCIEEEVKAAKEKYAKTGPIYDLRYCGNIVNFI